MLFDDTLLAAILRGALLAAVGLFWVILLVRLVGLRSFSKMTSVDFVMTVATGSLLAGAAQATTAAALAQALAAMAGLFALQCAIARLRRDAPALGAVLENEPLLLMRDGAFLDAALSRARVTRADLRAKLREANAGDLSQVRAVVLETTGDISVLHGTAVDEGVLDGVREAR